MPAMHGIMASGVNRLRPHALAASAGWIAGFGFAPYGLWLATEGGLAVFLALVASERRPVQAAIQGWLFGLGLFVPALSWLFSGLSTANEPVLALLGPLILMAGLALFPAVVALVIASSRASVLLRLVVLAPALWVLGEWIRHQGALAFPWLTVGYTQIPSGPLAGFAPVLGILGVSLATLVCAGLLAWMVVAVQPRKRRRAALAIGVIVLGGIVAARVEWTVPSGKPLAVALLQGNAPMTEKFSRGETARALRTYAALAARSAAPLIVMPETAFPLFEHQLPRDFLAFLRKLAWERQGDVVVSYFRTPSADTPYHYVSSARSVGVSGEQIYDKQHLLPFGEFVPFGRWLRPIYERMAKVRMLDTSPGAPDQGSRVLGGERVALRMCYEDAFGNERRQGIAQSKLLITLVNDSWDDATVPMHQHLQVSQARALEAAKPVLRAANTGWTVAIDHHGRVTDALPPETVGTLATRVQPRAGTTPYVLAGDALPMGLVGMGLLLSGMAERRARTTPERIGGRPA